MSHVKWVGVSPGKFEAIVKADVHDTLKKNALNIFNFIALMSPVDTGRFRANNIVSLNAPVLTSTEEKDYGTKEGEMQVTIMSAPKSTQRIYIQNNLPYAERLENGWSKQAPAGVYKVSFELIASLLK